MNNIITLLGILLLSVSAFSQDYTQTVKGKIIDADSESPVPFANVVLLESDPFKGVASNIDGNYKMLNVAIGRRSFKVSAIGYEDVYLNEIVISTGHEVVLNVEMQESISTLEEVTVVAESNPVEAINQMATVSANKITIESTSRIAAGINDPGRTAQSFAGVATSDDEGNELVVRGNSPRGVLWRMEGIEIPNPNHFVNGEGSSGGGVSALSTQVLGNSDFFTGAFPAEYGNALSGVFDLNLRKGNNEKREYTLQVGVLGVQAAVEGPFKKGSEASYLFNYRYSSLRLLSSAGIDIAGGSIAPGWQDLSYKIYLPSKKLGRFSIWGLVGSNDVGDLVDRDTSLWETRGDQYEYIEEGFLSVAGITHNYIFDNNKTYIKTVVAYSNNYDRGTEDFLDANFNKTRIEEYNFAYKTLSFSSFLNHKLNARNTFRLGVIAHNKGFAFDGKEFNYNTNQLERIIEDEGETNLYESYFQLKHRLTENIDIIPGVHFTQVALNGNTSIEPRLGIKWKLSERHSINFGSGLHSRSEAISLYLSEQVQADGTIVRPNEDLDLTKAVHGVVGHSWNISKNLNLKTELYYQHLYDVPISPDVNATTFSALNFRGGSANGDLVNEGTGKNYGVELSLNKFFANDWYMLVTTSLFESKYKMLDGVERNTLFNSKYILNLVGGKEFKVGKKKLNVLGANIRTILRGGYRTVPIDLEASILAGQTVRLYDQAFEEKATDYFRVDLGVSYKKNKPNWSWEISMNIQNTTNRANIYNEYYNSEKEAIEENTMVGLVPVLNYKVEF